MHRTIQRRAFLRAAGGLVAAGTLGAAVSWDRLLPAARAKGDGTALAHRSSADADRVFPQSVASGDPTPTGVLLWTRLAPSANRGTGVVLEVARDPAFTDVVHAGVVPAAHIRPESDHTLRVDLDGLLEPDRVYHYRFTHGGTTTRTGRCRTLPAEDAAVDRLRLAVLTCQNFQNGYFTAHRHVAREDVDFVVHLGDFIYEYNGDASYNGKTYPWRGIRLPSGAPRMETLEDLYYVHARYRSDPHLQAMLERHTLIATWDDHEIANDYHYDPQEGRHYGDDGFRLNGDPERLDQFFRDGVKAYFEWMPVRIGYEPDAEDPLDRVRLYRRFRFGNLLDLFMLDERWFRSPPPEGDEEAVGTHEGERTDPNRTLLGNAQRAWLFDGLRASDARWKGLGNPVQMSPLAATLPGTGVYVNLDAWDGYEGERRALADVFADVENAVVLTGDLHTFMAGYVMRDYHAPVPRDPDNLVAVEFMTPAVTSAGLGELVEEGLGNRGPLPPGFDAAHERAVLAGNPHMAHFNSNRHGYSILEFTAEAAVYSGYVVDKSTPDPNPAPFLLSRYEVPAGTVRLIERHRAFPDGVPPHQTVTDPRLQVLPEMGAEVRDVHDLPDAVRQAAAAAPASLRSRPEAGR